MNFRGYSVVFMLFRRGFGYLLENRFVLGILFGVDMSINLRKNICFLEGIMEGYNINFI